MTKHEDRHRQRMKHITGRWVGRREGIAVLLRKKSMIDFKRKENKIV